MPEPEMMPSRTSKEEGWWWGGVGVGGWRWFTERALRGGGWVVVRGVVVLRWRWWMLPGSFTERARESERWWAWVGGRAWRGRAAVAVVDAAPCPGRSLNERGRRLSENILFVEPAMYCIV